MPRLKLILAEDDPAMLPRFRSVLEDKVAEIAVVQSGWEMLALLSERPVDLVVSDLRLPEPSGIQVLSLARRLGFRVPFLLITGAADDSALRRRAATIRATLLQRPFSDADLVAAIDALGRETT